MKIDAHQHFWHYNATDFGWIGSDMAALQRNFLPEDLRPILTQAGIDGTIAVQARQTIPETEWLLNLAAANDFIKGIVGWVDLRAPTLESQLQSLTRFPKFRGVRHVVQDEPDTRFMLQPDFLRGISLLREFNLTYDLLLFPVHLPIACQVVAQFPAQRFVVDHIAKPPIRSGQLDPWKTDLQSLAAFNNVYCKVSGMITEAHWKQWQPDDFRSYLDVVFECFGPDRLLFGSDWPVCTVAGSYPQVVDLVQTYLQSQSSPTIAKIFGDNAVRFYQLPEAQ